MHNYLLVSSAQSVRISPLKGLSYLDKVDGSKEKIEEREEVEVKTFTDSVYKSAGGMYEVKWEGGDGMKLLVEGFGDVVIWNPQKEAGSKIEDMEDGGW